MKVIEKGFHLNMFLNTMDNNGDNEMEKLLTLPLWQLALLATLFTYGMTALGAALVFFFKEIKPNALKLMLGFASGIMVAASFWSLLDPAIEKAEENGQIAWLIVAAGFACGGLVLYLADRILPHLHIGASEPEGKKTSWQRSVLLVLSITLHNIPEGLAVGVAFGALQGSDNMEQALIGAMTIALGMGIQNFPEGAAVSIPLRQEGMSLGKSFFYGQASGIVEPIFGVLGVLLVTSMASILPFALAFAAGAMIYVVAEELIPEAKQYGNDHYMVFGLMAGFIIMMILDVALG